MYQGLCSLQSLHGNTCYVYSSHIPLGHYQHFSVLREKREGLGANIMSDIEGRTVIRVHEQLIEISVIQRATYVHVYKAYYLRNSVHT